MKKKSFYLGIVLLVLVTTKVFCKELNYANKVCTVKILYNEVSYPGDAVFVRMNFTQNSSTKTKEQNDIKKTNATLTLFQDEKKINACEFYLLPQESSTQQASYLCGIPLSSWLKKNTNYSLKINGSLQNGSTFDFDLPLELKHKDFISETIELDSRNTEIKTDSSNTRMQQINKLNALLAKVNKDNVYQTKKYIAPTTATRRTSFFADRRIYAYVDGNSSTSLHYGIDYGIPTGSKVTSCAKGKVVMAEDRISTGWSIVIEHLPGLYSLYYHLDKLLVKEGDVVQAGDLIGFSGSTGLATGPHLHWEMRLNMEAVSPDFFTSDFAFYDVSLSDTLNNELKNKKTTKKVNR